MEDEYDNMLRTLRECIHKHSKKWVSPTLKRADEIINGERQDQYGAPEMSFEIISDFWNLHNKWRKIRKGDAPYDNEDTSLMLDLMKHARMYGQQWHPDNAIDACGYLAILNDRIVR